MASKDSRAPTRYEVDGVNLPGGDARISARGGDIRFDGSAGGGAAGGGGDELPGPADLLAAALAACILKNVERFSRMLRFSYRRATIHVAVEREEPPPRIVRARYTLRVETDEPDARLELLHRNIRKFGTITNTLAAATDLEGEIVAVPPRRSPDRDAEVRSDELDRHVQEVDAENELERGGLEALDHRGSHLGADDRPAGEQ